MLAEEDEAGVMVGASAVIFCPGCAEREFGEMPGGS
jgi:hypothetical protein